MEAEWTWEAGWVGPSDLVDVLDAILEIRGLAGPAHNGIGHRQRQIIEATIDATGFRGLFEVLRETPPPELKRPSNGYTD